MFMNWTMRKESRPCSCAPRIAGSISRGETARYLLKRSRRDMASLYGLLDKLDLEALRAQRRLTIPFVRDVLKLPEGD